MSDIRTKILVALHSVEPLSTWTHVEGLPDEFYGPWSCGGWARVIGDKKVVVILSHEGAHHEKWKLFVNGKFVRAMEEVVLQMGSGRDAQRIAEKEIHRWN
jgi:hypothetical protein